MKITTVKFDNIAIDNYMRCDEKYYRIESSCNYNIFNLSQKNLILLSDIVKEDYLNFLFEDGQTYKGVPTGQTYIDEDGDLIDYQLISSEEHPERLKYALDKNHILISSLKLAKSPALLFEKLDFSKYVFSNGFYSLVVKNGWNKKYVLYLLRNKQIKNIIDNNIYKILICTR